MNRRLDNTLFYLYPKYEASIKHRKIKTAFIVSLILYIIYFLR